ncbi:MAG: cyclic nucleotide-binding domain-containing protein [Rhodothermales bacterium]|nr:cyclic nucleotide-binding domain-containing protein [Rhodothermales bacterium]
MAVFRSIAATLRRGYRRMFQREVDAHTREAADALRQVELFRFLSGGALHDLAEVVHRRRYRRDEYLYYENDPGLGLYVVLHGAVRLLVEDDGGGQREVRQVTEHGFFGDLALLGDFRRLETAQAVTETDVLGFFTPDLKTLMKRNPGVGGEVALALARHLAARQVALIDEVAKDAGRVGALRLLRGTAARVP